MKENVVNDLFFWGSAHQLGIYLYSVYAINEQIYGAAGVKKTTNLK